MFDVRVLGVALMTNGERGIRISFTDESNGVEQMLLYSQTNEGDVLVLDRINKDDLEVLSFSLDEGLELTVKHGPLVGHVFAAGDHGLLYAQRQPSGDNVYVGYFQEDQTSTYRIAGHDFVVTHSHGTKVVNAKLLLNGDVKCELN
ncbi:hypothetical protein BC351_32600 [Paenibacillus ferrarius]|uniref:Uncharacterized protein n=1 Tax=Paenibacillus ferrarius TaxID=1469647 RepID=A0A1V4HEV1_9BACL|nr:hypothetical protein [Paenibacillus ferrarius]OPH52999.1 hypothetical protein BC351_32600 [Paenibacillus ferrarius]